MGPLLGMCVLALSVFAPSVSHAQTVLRSGRPVVIPRAMIGRVYRVRRDPPWEGSVIGVLVGLVMRAAYRGEGCLSDPEPACTLKGLAALGAMGAAIDYGIDDVRVVYKAPKTSAPASGRPTITLLRLAF